MTLLDKAYLVIDTEGNTGTFELQTNLDHQTDVTKMYIMGGGGLGQYISNVGNLTPIPTSANEGQSTTRRTGYWIDGGAGEWEVTLNFENGPDDDVDWGDGSGGTGQSNVTSLDASGSGVERLSRINVLNQWIAKTRSDSFGQAFVYWGEWADGTFASSAGAMGAPMPVAIRNLNTSTDVQEPAVFSGTLEMAHVTIFPGQEISNRLVNSVNDFFQQINDALSANPDN